MRVRTVSWALLALAVIAAPASANPPQVQSVSPSSGPTAGGTTLLIKGKAFGKKAGSVTAAGVPCTVLSWAAKEIVCVTGAAASPGTGAVVVTTKDGDVASLADAFTYVAPPPPPSIQSLVITEAPVAGGEQVVILGSNFDEDATVHFGDQESPFVFVFASGGEIVCLAPPHEAGTVDVAVTNPDGQDDVAEDAFTYFEPDPPSETAGQLDPDFGVDGILDAGDVENLGTGTSQRMAIDADGSVVLLGGAGAYHVTLLDADGSHVWTETYFASSHPNGQGGVAIDGDGRIVVTGQVWNGSTYDMVIVRLLPEDGSLDETFGDDGIVVNSLVGGFLSTVAIQPDGKIVIGAQADIDHAAVFRYLEDGTLDPDFGATGAGYTVGPYVSHWNGGMGMALDGEGRIVIGEYGDWTFVRYQADGSVDTGFGDGGIVEDELPETRNDGGNLSRFVIDSSDRIVAVGDTEFRDKDEHVLPGFGSVVAVTRYNEDGSPDTSLAGTGRFYVPFLDETGHWFNGVRALTLDGERIVLAATYYTWTDNVFFLLRLNGDGTYDTNFGPDGNGFSAEAMLGWETHQLGLRIDPDGAYRVPFAIVRDSSYETIAVGAARTLAE